MMDVVLVGAEKVMAAACGAPDGVTEQAHPVIAAGIVITPLDVIPPVPTLSVKAAVPLFAGIEGEAPNPLAIVGAVPFQALLVNLAPTVKFPVWSIINVVFESASIFAMPMTLHVPTAVGIKMMLCG